LHKIYANISNYGTMSLGWLWGPKYV
jgi:hypothetical protein